MLLLAAAAVPADERVERRLAVMGTTLTVTVEAADRRSALAASERAVGAVEAAEARLTTWRPEGELARLNAAPVGRTVTLSPRLAADLAAARRCWQETEGAFDPTVGALVAAWGLRHGGRVPTEGERRAARAATGMAGLELRPSGDAVRWVPGLTLDEGGFGKGAALADALAALGGDPRVRGALLDLGGQVAALGGRGWRIAVADPRERDRPVLAWSIDGGSVATSGNSERGLEVAGRRIGHLLDPRRGVPARDFGSLTVWTESPLVADCLATGLYVLGPERALAWGASHPGVEVLALEAREQGPVVARATPLLAARLELLADGVEVVAPPSEGSLKGGPRRAAGPGSETRAAACKTRATVDPPEPGAAWRPRVSS